MRLSIVSVVLLAAMAVVNFGIVGLGTVSANGGVVNFQTKSDGPYQISLGTVPASPTLGNLHITIFVTEIASGALVLDADVTVVGIAPDASEFSIGRVALEELSDDPKFYDVTTSLDQEGVWKFEVEVSGPAGRGVVEYEIEVVRTNPIGAILALVFLISLVVIITLAVRRHISKRRHGTVGSVR